MISEHVFKASSRTETYHQLAAPRCESSGEGTTEKTEWTESGGVNFRFFRAFRGSSNQTAISLQDPEVIEKGNHGSYGSIG